MLLFCVFTLFTLLQLSVTAGSHHKDALDPPHVHHHTPRRLEERSYSGTATWYDTQTGNKGTCGSYLSNSGWTVALNSAQWDGGAHCWKSVVITARGKTQTATVVDQCPPPCSWGDLDLTPSLFSSFASQNDGVVQISWVFASEGDTNSKASTTPKWTSKSSTSKAWTPSSSIQWSQTTSKVLSSWQSSSKTSSAWSSRHSSLLGSTNSTTVAGNFTSTTSGTNSTVAPTSSGSTTTSTDGLTNTSSVGGSVAGVYQAVFQLAKIIVEAVDGDVL